MRLPLGRWRCSYWPAPLRGTRRSGPRWQAHDDQRDSITRWTGHIDGDAHGHIPDRQSVDHDQPCSSGRHGNDQSAAGRTGEADLGHRKGGPRRHQYLLRVSLQPGDAAHCRLAVRQVAGQFKAWCGTLLPKRRFGLGNYREHGCARNHQTPLKSEEPDFPRLPPPSRPSGPPRTGRCTRSGRCRRAARHQARSDGVVDPPGRGRRLRSRGRPRCRLCRVVAGPAQRSELDRTRQLVRRRPGTVGRRALPGASP